jgi:hypothetical protein
MKKVLLITGLIIAGLATLACIIPSFVLLYIGLFGGNVGDGQVGAAFTLFFLSVLPIAGAVACYFELAA